MRWSIESRVPFLTTSFVDLCLSMPESYIISDKGESKHIFRDAMRGIVPSEVLYGKIKLALRPQRIRYLRIYPRI